MLSELAVSHRLSAARGQRLHYSKAIITHTVLE